MLGLPYKEQSISNCYGDHNDMRHEANLHVATDPLSCRAGSGLCNYTDW